MADTKWRDKEFERQVLIPEEVKLLNKMGAQGEAVSKLLISQPGPLRAAPDIGGVDRKLVKRRVLALPVCRLCGESAVEGLVADKQGDTPVAAASRREVTPGGETHGIGSIVGQRSAVPPLLVEIRTLEEQPPLRCEVVFKPCVQADVLGIGLDVDGASLILADDLVAIGLKVVAGKGPADALVVSAGEDVGLGVPLIPHIDGSGDLFFFHTSGSDVDDSTESVVAPDVGAASA